MKLYVGSLRQGSGVTLLIQVRRQQTRCLLGCHLIATFGDMGWGILPEGYHQMATPKSVRVNIKPHLVLSCASFLLQQRPKKRSAVSSSFRLSAPSFGFERLRNILPGLRIESFPEQRRLSAPSLNKWGTLPLLETLNS